VDDGIEGNEPESGKSLRDRLAEAERARRELETEVTGYRAKEIISSKGFTHVKPEDLVGVASTDLEKKAEEIEAAKAALESEVLKAALLRRGVSADEVEGAVAQLLGKSEEQDQSESLALLSQVSKVAGTPAPRTNPDLFGPDLIEAELLQKEQRSKR